MLLFQIQLDKENALPETTVGDLRTGPLFLPQDLTCILCSHFRSLGLPCLLRMGLHSTTAYLLDIAYYIHTRKKLCLPALLWGLAGSFLSPVQIISVFPIGPHFLDLKLFDYSSPSLCSATLCFLGASALTRCNTSTEDLPVDKKRLFCTFYSLYSYFHHTRYNVCPFATSGILENCHLITCSLP